MGNRATRRVEAARFRREVGRALTSYLIDAADARLADAPLLRNAIWHWRSNVVRRRPFCCACRASFVDEATAAAFLLNVLANQTTVATSALCETCWRDLPDDVLRGHALRVAGTLMPGARFADT